MEEEHEVLIGCGCKFHHAKVRDEQAINFFNSSNYKCPKCLKIVKMELD